MGPSGFTSSWTSGELCDDAWDRDDIQPLAKGCEQGQNLIIRIAGPLGKRRGFWFNGLANDQTHRTRLIPFIRSIGDACVIELGDAMGWIWETNGAPRLDGGVQVSFSTPYPGSQLAGVRFKQIGDVIEFRHSSGTVAPQALSRAASGLHDADWTFAAKSYVNGPWLSENTDLSSTITLTNTAGPSDVIDTNPRSGAGAIPAGATVTIAATKPIFSAGQVGAQLRIRANGASLSCFGWSPGQLFRLGSFVSSVGNMYLTTTQGTDKNGSNPPVQLQGSQSDGDNTFGFLHDGAGIVTLTGFTDAQHVTGTVVHTCPIASATATSYYAWGAYGGLNGWPSATPELREERLTDGATAANPDFVDLTQTAGFTPTTEDFTPGTGLGLVTDVNAIRRRVGVDGGQINNFATATYLVAFTETTEQLIAGSVLDEPLSPSAVTVKELSTYGSTDAVPVKAHKGLLWITKDGQTLRELSVDTGQAASGEDHSFLATHIASRGFSKLAWVGPPDNNCWLMLDDTGFACFTYQKEQQVKGFTQQLLAAGMTVVEQIVMPGEGNVDTLWVVAAQTVAGVTSKFLMLQSARNDSLFMDAALEYAGAAVGEFGDIPAIFEGQLVDVLTSNGRWFPQLPVTGGTVTLPGGAVATGAQIGFTYPIAFTSLKLNLKVFNGALLQRQRIASCIVDVKTALCTVSGDGVDGETLDARVEADVQGTSAKRFNREFTIQTTGDSETGDRDPRIVITEQTPYDFVLYALKPNLVAAGD